MRSAKCEMRNETLRFAILTSRSAFRISASIVSHHNLRYKCCGSDLELFNEEAGLYVVISFLFALHLSEQRNEVPIC